MKTLFRDWPVMAHDTHTRRRLCCFRWTTNPRTTSRS